ncbi:unnamed protein product, partial [Schistosoma mattheei]
VTQAHVREAFALLNKSIIRVEQPDINLEEEDQHQLTDASETPVIDQPTTETNTTAGHLRVTYDEYRRIASLLILRARNWCETLATDSESDQTPGAPKRSELVNWYLEEVVDEFETEAQLAEVKLLVERIIDRLIKKDNILITIGGTGLDASADTADPYIVVHPNYVE